jgi:hypothetical protein
MESIMPPARKNLLTTASAALFCLLSFSALADRVFWRGNFRPSTLNAGPLTCYQDVSLLSCKLGDKTLFHVDAFADHLAVSDKGQYIVGLSNRGGVPLFWLRNFDGEEIGLIPVSEIGFCKESVTNVRQWFDEKTPEVTFQFNDDRLTNVIVRGCDGKEVFFHLVKDTEIGPDYDIPAHSLPKLWLVGTASRQTITADSPNISHLRTTADSSNISHLQIIGYERNYASGNSRSREASHRKSVEICQSATQGARSSWSAAVTPVPHWGPACPRVPRGFASLR